MKADPENPARAYSNSKICRYRVTTVVNQENHAIYYIDIVDPTENVS